jgi:hypothetical protein
LGALATNTRHSDGTHEWFLEHILPTPGCDRDPYGTKKSIITGILKPGTPDKSQAMPVTVAGMENV